MAKFTETTTYTVNCPACDSSRVVKTGKQNGQQRYLCRECSKKFRANGIAHGHRVPVEQIGMAIRMFYSGMSYKQIAESMSDAFDIPEPSKATIYEWVRAYTDKAVETLGQPQYKAQTGDEWVADEMQVTVGGEKYWNWNVMHSKTSDIPEQPVDWSKARRGMFYKPDWQDITLRLDRNVVDWFEEQAETPEEAQQAINQALVEHMRRVRFPGRRAAREAAD